MCIVLGVVSAASAAAARKAQAFLVFIFFFCARVYATSHCIYKPNGKLVRLPTRIGSATTATPIRQTLL